MSIVTIIITVLLCIAVKFFEMGTANLLGGVF